MRIKKLVQFFLSTVLFFGMTPMAAHAFELELVSGGDSLTEFSDQVQAPSEEVVLTAWASDDPVGTTYDLVFSVVSESEDDVPAVLVVLGDIGDEGWEYDSDTGLLTVTVTSADFGDIEQGPPAESFFIVAAIGAVDEGEDGPPIEATGMYMSTNVMEWEINPPSEEESRFGFVLTGPEGHVGFFKFFVPYDLIEYIDTTIDNLVLFEDDSQASISLTDTGEGALFEIDITFEGDEITAQNVIASSSDVTKVFAAGDALSISLASTKSVVEKQEKTKLFGWIKSKKKNQTVTLWKKAGKAETWGKFETVKTIKAGYFSTKVKVSQKTKFQARFKNKKGKIQKSPVQTVSVK